MLKILMLGLLLSSYVFAQDYAYPELSVSPRASERLKIEESENSSWMIHAPLQISALTTLAAGLNSSSIKEGKTDKAAFTAATAVGAGWFGVSLWMQLYYKPYYLGLQSIKRIPNKSPREQLIYERMAEEHINNAASLAKKIKWLSFTTNLGTSLWVMTESKSGSTGKNLGIIGTVAAFGPLLFPYRWESVAEEQKNYKKKIFGPITMNTTLLSAPGEVNSFIPGMMATASF